MTTMPKKKPTPPARSARFGINATIEIRPLLHMLTGILQAEHKRYVPQHEALLIAVREAIEARGYDPDEETP